MFDKAMKGVQPIFIPAVIFSQHTCPPGQPPRRGAITGSTAEYL